MHEVNIRGGKRQEKHLCERCAREQGVNVAHATPTAATILQTFLAVKSSIDSPQPVPQNPAVPTTTGTCQACGQTFTNFRSTGVLGCPQCYAAFESQLSPLLGRAHEGGTHHVGKCPVGQTILGKPPAPPIPPPAPPRTTPPPAGPAVHQRIAALRKSLEQAIAGEQYERAAQLRDELHRIQSAYGLGASSSAGPASPPSPIPEDQE